MLILGIDPGYAITGFGVVHSLGGNRMKTLDFGAITTEAGIPFEMRLKEIYADIGFIMDKHTPDHTAIEKLFFTTNQKTAIYAAQARGVIVLAAVNRGIPVYEYTPLQVKSSVTGYGKAVKKQIQQMTKNILKLDETPKPDDAADALAIAICHANSFRSFLPK